MSLTKNKMSDASRLSAHIVVLVLLLLMALGINSYSVYKESKHPERMAVLEQAYNDKQQQAFDAALAIRQKQMALISGDDFQVDTSRIERDFQMAEGVMKTVFGWKDYESYMQAREDLKTRYGLSEDDRFLSVFLPSVSESEPVLSGERYNWIDVNGYNVYYDGMVQYFLGEAKGEYRYLSEIDWSTVAKNGGEARQTSVFIYSVDKDGHIGSMDAYVID